MTLLFIILSCGCWRSCLCSYSGGLEIALSSITVSWGGVAYMALATSSESGGSVYLRFAFGCFTFWFESIEVNFSSVRWYDGGWVYGGVGGDIYCRRVDYWLMSCLWLFGVNSCWGILCSPSVALTILITLRFMILICCAIMSSHVFINVVWKSFRVSLKF